MASLVATHQFPNDQRAPGESRRFTRETLAGWGLGELSEVAELLVSEMVTNAVGHAASGGAVVMCRTDSGIRVEVSDSGAGEVRPRSAEPHDVGGRGMAIVATLSSRWGVTTESADGAAAKTVWFELDDGA